jgi:hypothetical protein
VNGSVRAVVGDKVMTLRVAWSRLNVVRMSRQRTTDMASSLATKGPAAAAGQVHARMRDSLRLPMRSKTPWLPMLWP